MIKALFKAYKLQIFIAFALVIVENVTFIAEPYIFGQAIDDLREANVIEEEVDSTIANTMVRQAIDSVREHLLDSLMQRDSLREEEIDTTISSLYLPQGESQSEIRVIPALYMQNEQETLEPPVLTPLELSLERFLRRKAKRDSIRGEFDKNLQSISTTQGDSARRESLRKLGLSPGARRKLREILAERDSMRTLLRSGSIAKTKVRKEGRDSLRAAIKKKPRTHPKLTDDINGLKHPVSFFFPKDFGPFIPAMLPWVILYLISSGVGAWRRYYDTKIYTRMFANLSSKVVEKQLLQGEEISKIAGRSTLAWNNIEFFQYSLPEFIEQIINVGGAVLALSLFDWRLAAIGASLIAMVVYASKFYMARIGIFKREINDLKEVEYDTFGTKDPANIRSYYTKISDLEVKVSRMDTLGYMILRGGLLVMFIGTLYISLDLDRFTIGEVYSIVAYVWTFVTASEYIPYLSEKWVNLRDITRRLETEDMLDFGDIKL